MDYDLRGKHWVTFGKKDTGKSYLQRWLMDRMTEPYLAFDPMHEYEGEGPDDVVVRPSATRGSQAEEDLDDAVRFLQANMDHFGYMVLDEVNRFHRKGGGLAGPVGELIDLNAHYGVGVGMVARRPAQVHTDLRELADYLFIFRLTGTNDIRALDGIVRGLGERAASLDRREFIVVEPSGHYERMDPIGDRVDHRKGMAP